MRGHYWTIAPFVRGIFRAPVEPAGARGFATFVEDPVIGRVRIVGRLSEPHGARSLVLIVHGLGGSAESPYAIDAQRAADAAGLASLRLSLRGAERDGEDLYHAALTADVHAALRAPELARYRRIGVIGYSLGGHLSLRFATEVEDSRVRAVAAVCPPLDLDRGATALDRPERWIYRQHVLRGLKEMYRALARRKTYRLPAPMREVMAVRTLREWDSLTVARRHGFGTAERYYAESSVAPRLAGALRVPTRIVSAIPDPMVPHHTVEPAVPPSGTNLHVDFIANAGHVGFPASLDLGEAGPRGLEPQIVAWLARQLER